MEVGTLVKEHLFTTKQGEVVERLGIVTKDQADTDFDGYVEVAWSVRPEHPIGNGETVSIVLTEVAKLQVLSVPPEKGNE